MTRGKLSYSFRNKIHEQGSIRNKFGSFLEKLAGHSNQTLDGLEQGAGRMGESGDLSSYFIGCGGLMSTQERRETVSPHSLEISRAPWLAKFPALLPARP